MTMRLETERLILRRPVAADYDAFRAFAAAGGLRHIYGTLTEGQVFRSFATELGHWEMLGFGMWTVTFKGSDQAVGLVGPWRPADWPENELGWMIYGNAEGKGIAQEAATAARADAYARLGWKTAVSYIAPENLRSIRLAERLGAVLDPSAKTPAPDKPCLVYRHPAPAELALGKTLETAR
jgi:RimJ/RimL family protein N-acetyltransferase